MDPSEELHSMQSIMRTMMMQSTKTAELMAQLRMTHLEVENQLQLLSAKIQQHEEALRAERSNGAAARTVKTVEKHGVATMTETLAEVYPVLQAVAVVHEEQKKKKRKTAAEKTNGDGAHGGAAGVAPVVQQTDQKPPAALIVFQKKLFNDAAFTAQKLALQKFKVGSAERAAMFSQLYKDYKDSIPTATAPALAKSAAAPAGAAASAKAVGKEAQVQGIETDSDDDDDNLEKWDFRALIAELRFKFACFDQEQLSPYSVWIIEQLEFAYDFPTESKDKIFRKMCTAEKIWNMTKFNDLLKQTFEGHLSKPCFLEDEKWDEEVVAAFEVWKTRVPSASLDRFISDSPLHTCTVHDFREVQEEMDKFLESSQSIDWPTFATELLVLCAMMLGNAPGLPGEKHRGALLPSVQGQFKHA